MAAGAYEFAICGSTVFARLLAGILATAHGRRVCLVGDPLSPYRLPRTLDISVMPATRPETWLLLKRGSVETLKLLATVGKGLHERVDPLFVAESSPMIERLGHMRWVAAGTGFAAERTVERTITQSGAICRIRDASMLVAEKVDPAIDAWLTKSGVRLLSPRDVTISPLRDGGFALASSPALEAQSVILADDGAILERLPAAERHRLLTILPRTSLVTEPAKPVAAPFLAYLDREVTLHQRPARALASITALAGGEADTALSRIGSALAASGRLRRSGQARFLGVGTADGAPLFGRMGKAKLTAIAGLGPSAAFLAPIVARHLAGTASPEEAAWFLARDVSKAASRASVAETATGAEDEVAS